MGPTSTDPKCLTWLYYSAVNGTQDTATGLVGPLLVCRKGSLGKDGKQVSQGTRIRVCLGEQWPGTGTQREGIVAISLLHFRDLKSPSSLASTADLYLPAPDECPRWRVPWTPPLPLDCANPSPPSGQPPAAPPSSRPASSPLLCNTSHQITTALF